MSEKNIGKRLQELGRLKLSESAKNAEQTCSVSPELTEKQQKIRSNLEFIGFFSLIIAGLAVFLAIGITFNLGMSKFMRWAYGNTISPEQKAPFYDPLDYAWQQVLPHDILDYIVDGDTIHLRNKGRIRFADCDAYELNTSMGQYQARQLKKNVPKGSTIAYQPYGLGYYGRTIASVYLVRNSTYTDLCDLIH